MKRVRTSFVVAFLVLAAVLMNIFGCKAQTPPSPPPTPTPRPPIATSTSVPAPTPQQPKEQYYSSVNQYNNAIFAEVKSRLSLPTRHSEPKSEFETSAAYAEKQAKWQAEYEMALKKYLNSLDLSDIEHQTISVIIKDVSVGTYDADRGQYTITVKKFPAGFEGDEAIIVAPLGISFYYCQLH